MEEKIITEYPIKIQRSTHSYIYIAYKINGEFAKKCTMCGEIKLVDEFYKRKGRGIFGRVAECKLCSCAREHNMDDANRKKHNDLHKRWFSENKEHVREYNKKYREDNKKILRYNYKIYLREKKKNDLNFRIRIKLGKIMHDYVKKRRRSNTASKLLGCSIDEFRIYMASKFRDGMTWENHGILWEIDHIFPLSKFDLTDEYQQRIAFNYNNMQPLLRKENREKWDKVLPMDHKLVSISKNCA
jgi:hypothetical protein